MMISVVYYLIAVCIGMTLSVVVWLFKNRNQSKEIPLKSVEKIVEEANFWSSVERVVKGEAENDAKLEDTGFVYVLMPCEHHNCACSESREDCCFTKVDIGDERYCRVLVNINRLCGLPDGKDKPDANLILTDEEAKILGDKIVEFIQEIKREKLS